MRARRFVRWFAAALVLMAAPGCMQYSARVRVTNDTSSSHLVKFDGFGEHTLAAGEVYSWDVGWSPAPGDDTRKLFDVWIDGRNCLTYHIWDGETDRVLTLGSSIQFCGTMSDATDESAWSDRVCG
jgi:hypothetical protein